MSGIWILEQLAFGLSCWCMHR